MVMSVVPLLEPTKKAVFRTQRAIQRKHHQQQSNEELSLRNDEETGVGEEADDNMAVVQPGARRTKKVLILMSDTGGGHRASAEAIRDTFYMQLGDVYQVIIKNLWKETLGWPLNDLEGSYKFMVKHILLWLIVYCATAPRWVHCMYLGILAILYTKNVDAALRKDKPDIIINMHPLMQHIPLRVLSWQGLLGSVKFVTVITDLSTCHPTWFHPGVGRCYCPSKEVFNKALLYGLEPGQVCVFGLPIRPSFCCAVFDKDELRKELQMDHELPVVLLMGGGEGMGPVKNTAMALGDALFDKESGKPIRQIVIICGRNQNIRSALEATEWQVPVKIRGFETQMEKWMGACDCIITKAGPGTIAEALIIGLPIILNDFIPGQEYSPKARRTANLVARWFGPEKHELKRMSENALKLAQPDAVFHFVKDIHELSEL